MCFGSFRCVATTYHTEGGELDAPITVHVSLVLPIHFRVFSGVWAPFL
jgi:hypothetical protein